MERYFLFIGAALLYLSILATVYFNIQPAYGLFHYTCHQLWFRSYCLYDGLVQDCAAPADTAPKFPVCARCFGIYLGFLMGSMVRVPKKYRLYLLTLWLPLLVDGSLQFLGFYESTNQIRLISGVLTGFSSSAFFIASLGERNRR